MEESTFEQQLAEEFDKRGTGIRNRAALGALVKVIPLGGALHHAFTAGDQAIADEKIQLQLDLLCKMAEKFDAAISELVSEASEKGITTKEISAIINVSAENSESVTGLDVSGSSGVSVKPGTVVNVDVKDVKNVVGVKI